MIFGINWQFIAVGIVLLAVVIWILVRLFGKKYRNQEFSGCAGCGLSEACNKQKTKLAQDCSDKVKKNDNTIG